MNDWENQKLVGINKMDGHTVYPPFDDKDDAERKQDDICRYAVAFHHG